MDNKTLVINYQMAVSDVLQSGTGDSYKQYLSENISWHLPQSMAEFGGSVFQGIAGVEQMLTENIRRFYQPETIQVDFRSMIGEGEYVHMHFGMSAATANNKNYQNDYQILFQVEDGLIINVWEYFDAHALIRLIA
jgi:ketosteroid isomerase-like protein